MKEKKERKKQRKNERKRKKRKKEKGKIKRKRERGKKGRVNERKIKRKIENQKGGGGAGERQKMKEGTSTVFLKTRPVPGIMPGTGQDGIPTLDVAQMCMFARSLACSLLFARSCLLALFVRALVHSVT